MDEYLREIHTMIFRQWIMNQSRDGFLVTQTADPDIIAIDTATSHSEISFNPMDIIEFSVTSRVHHRAEFYIHFQMNTLSHALGLYVEMLECIQELQNVKTTKILLCCSSGMTTGMFSQDLNKACKLLGLNYEFNAVSYTKLYEVGTNYDVILLAPQISFEHAKIIQVLKDPLIIKIPPRIFAKYNVNEMLAVIKKEMDSFESTTSDISFNAHSQLPYTKQKILCISIKRVQAPRININYRLFHKGKVVAENEIIKTNISEKDIYDIVEVMFAKYPDIKIVGISMLGIVHEKGVYLPGHILNGFDFMTPLRDRYPAIFILENDVNCAALGYYTTQNQYQSISMVTKTRQDKPGGVGSIINGQLITGKNHLAGEVQFLPLDMSSYAADYNGFVEQLAHSILSVSAVIAPEAIVIYSPVVSEIEDITYYITQKLPRRFLPDLILIDDLREFSTLGLLRLCIDEIEKKQN